jgi:catecholate siderophore receptor
MLAGTDLTFRRLATNAAALEFRTASESVSVTAPRPGTRVASPKYTEPLRDVPQTITVIPRAVIEEQGAATLRDVLRNVTGITFQAGEGGTPAGDQMTIRGFSARTDMFVDGVRDFGGYARDTFNLEQVEVSKGPASAIAGRGATGGSVNLVSKRPNLAPSRALTVEGGSADHKRLTADVNQPIAGLAGASLRLNAMWMDTGVPGRDVVENRSWGLAPTAGFGVGSPTRLTLSYLHLDQDNVPDYGLPWVPAANIPLAAYANGRPPVDRSNFYGLIARDYETVKNDLGTVQVEHDLTPAFTVRNLTRFGRTYRDSVITPPRFLDTTSTIIRRTDVKSRDQHDGILANQTNLTGRFDTRALAHTIVAENSRTLEDLVNEMLRPMLKSWLDENLPALVERLVRQEIEHVSRGRR